MLLLDPSPPEFRALGSRKPWRCAPRAPSACRRSEAFRRQVTIGRNAPPGCRPQVIQDGHCLERQAWLLAHSGRVRERLSC